MPADQNPASRRRLKLGLLAAAVVLAAAFAGRNAILGQPVVAHEAARSDLVQTVVASGRIVTPQRVAIGAVTTGRVTRIPVSEGQSVKRGDILIELEDGDERAAVEQARAAVAQAEAKIRQLSELGFPAAQQSLIQAEAQAVQARRQYERSRELKEKGFVSQAALDEVQRNLDVAESQLRAARLQVKSASPAGSEAALARTALAQARASLGLAQAKLDETLIRAPVHGVLIARAVEPGNVVQPGRELMALAPLGETQVVVQIDEKNLSQLKLGQQALGSADAFPRGRFAAQLFYINPGIDPQRGSVEVKLRVPDPPPYLRQDMTVSVDIEVARRAGVLVVPADAVHDAGSARPWVLAIAGGRAERREVTIGLRGDGRIEIAGGLEAGERVVPASNLAVKAGMRVRPAGKDGAG